MLANFTSVALTIVGALTWGLLLGGISRSVTARIHGRMGPRITQNFIDLWKLFRKTSSIHHGGMFWMAPMFRITGAICVLLMVPLVIGQNITYNMSFAGDVFLLIYIMFFGCLGMALGAGNSGHPYAVIAVSRGLAQMSSYELSFSIAVVAIAVGLHTFRIEGIVEAQQAGITSWNIFRFPFASAGALLAFLPMQMAYPFGIVLAPQEIPIGPPTEYSSRMLSFMFSGRALFGVAKLVLFVSLLFGGASSWLSLFAKTFLLYMYPIVVSSVFPRFRTEQSIRFLWFIPTTLALVDLVRVML
ncbi:MAG: complex I subunit 1 family protein [Candidatus Fermentibacteria bacterium]|nr:complex I subunit 1 family protein [Candidatus Fermentibacteria bacterium]